ncbi:MAG: peptidylprolyl isomerase [Ferrimicrobium sp.]|uniref:peptidylprolyl isomerase n=1 Tax=Ferrimicrobium sp. TaxID=2926050 RepID=UPI00261F217B|nr:peptidylprolyl isomerase [Ferrimicrobium sp.]
MSRRLLKFLPLALGFVLASCSTIGYAAKVGPQTISNSQLHTELREVSSNSAFDALLSKNKSPVFGPDKKSYTTLFVDNILNRRITIDRILQAEHRLNITPTPLEAQLAKVLTVQSVGSQSTFAAFPKTYQAQLVSDTRAIVAMEAYLAKVNLSTAGVHAYYASHHGSFVDVCSSEILETSPLEADAVLAKIRGGLSFAAAANQYSEDKSSQASGGAVGCGTISQYEQVLGANYTHAIETLPIGKASLPVQISQGWSIVEVTSRTLIPFHAAELSAANDELGHGSVLLNDFLARDSKSQTLKVNPEYGRVKDVGGVLQVAPSKGPSPKALSQYFTPGLAR